MCAKPCRSPVGSASTTNTSFAGLSFRPPCVNCTCEDSCAGAVTPRSSAVQPPSGAVAGQQSISSCTNSLKQAPGAVTPRSSAVQPRSDAVAGQQSISSCTNSLKQALASLIQSCYWGSTPRIRATWNLHRAGIDSREVPALLDELIRVRAVEEHRFGAWISVTGAGRKLYKTLS
jgi:hypothetical protein